MGVGTAFPRSPSLCASGLGVARPVRRDMEGRSGTGDFQGQVRKDDVASALLTGTLQLGLELSAKGLAASGHMDRPHVDPLPAVPGFQGSQCRL